MYTVITDFEGQPDKQTFATEVQVLDYYCNCLIGLCAVKPEEVKVLYKKEQLKIKIILEKQEEY